MNDNIKWLFPNLSEPACYKHPKRENHLHTLREARECLRAETEEGRTLVKGAIFPFFWFFCRHNDFDSFSFGEADRYPPCESNGREIFPFFSCFIIELAQEPDAGPSCQRGDAPLKRLSLDQAAWSKRCRNRGSLARPYIDRFTTLRFRTWASTGPLLTESVSPAMTASLSLHKLRAKRLRSGI